MNLFSTIENLLEAMGSPLETVVELVIGLIAVGFVIKPFISAVRAFGSGNWVEALESGARIVAIALIAVIAVVGLRALGEGSGSDLNQFIQSNTMALGSGLFYLKLKMSEWKNETITNQ